MPFINIMGIPLQGSDQISGALQWIDTYTGKKIIVDHPATAIDSAFSLINRWANVVGLINISNLSSGVGIKINNSSTGYGIALNNTSTGITLDITNSSTGKGLNITNSVGGNAIYVTNSLAGTGIALANLGSGFGILCDNSNSGYAASFVNTGAGTACFIQNSGTGKGAFFQATADAKEIINLDRGKIKANLAANRAMGVATILDTNTTVVVNNTSVTANSKFFLQAINGTYGADLHVINLVAGTSFTIEAAAAVGANTDIFWMMVN